MHSLTYTEMKWSQTLESTGNELTKKESSIGFRQMVWANIDLEGTSASHC